MWGTLNSCTTVYRYYKKNCQIPSPEVGKNAPHLPASLPIPADTVMRIDQCCGKP